MHFARILQVEPINFAGIEGYREELYNHASTLLAHEFSKESPSEENIEILSLLLEKTLVLDSRGEETYTRALRSCIDMTETAKQSKLVFKEPPTYYKALFNRLTKTRLKKSLEVTKRLHMGHKEARDDELMEMQTMETIAMNACGVFISSSKPPNFFRSH